MLQPRIHWDIQIRLETKFLVSTHVTTQSSLTTYSIALVQPNDIISNNVILPLAVGMLWEYAKTDSQVASKWQLQHTIYQKECVDQLAKTLSQCDLVVFSTYAWNSVYNMDLARQIKLHNKNCFTLIGGPHITTNIDNFWQDHAQFIDLALIGEGEDSFLQVLKQWPNLDVDRIPGAWTKNYYKESAPRFENLQILPSPYLNGFYDQIVREAKQQGHALQAVLQTNRGCPYHCTFCEEGKDYKNKMFFYDHHRIMKEIEWCGQNSIEYLSMADDNWGIAYRDLEFMESICKTKIKYGYPQILDATYAKNAQDRVLELAKIDKEYKTDLIRGITLALQTTHSPTLDSIKRFNLSPIKQHDYVIELKKLKVPIYVELIWPLPYETYSSFINGIELNIDAGLDNWVGVYPLSMQTSADLFDDYKDDYQWAPAPSNDNIQMKSHIFMNNPMASRWADFDTTVKGHVFYHWLVVLYFFGFARHSFDLLKKNGIPVTQSVENFIKHVEKSNGKILQIHDRLIRYWKNWLQNIPENSFDSFPEDDTNFWYPYTHLASFLQVNFDDYAKEINNFLSNYDIESLSADINYHGVVRYGTTYPYVCDDKIIDIDHQQPAFANLFEFCRYYYWWRRKKGSSRTIITNLSAS